MESACGIQINNCINFTSGTACQHSGAPHRSKWNGCTAYAEQLSRFTVTCTYIFNADGTMEDGRVILTNKNNNGVSDYKGGAVSKAMTNGTYYFNENSGSVNGQMVTGKTTVTKDGEDFYYYFDKATGRAVTDVVKDGIIYGHDGERIDAEYGNTNAIVTLDYPVAYSKSEVDVVIDGKTVKGIPACTNNEIIVSATGKLKTSGTVKVDGVRYKIHSEYWTLERLDD